MKCLPWLAAALAGALPAAVLAQPAAAPPAEQVASLTVDSTVGELLDNPAAREILRRHVPVIADSPQIAAARDIPFRALARYAPTLLTEAKLAAISEDLARTPAAVASGKRKPAAAVSYDPRIALSLKTVRLWEGDAPGAKGKGPDDTPTLTIVGPDGATSFGSAVIVAPGGGYQALASGLEGRQVADWFAAQGVTAFVLSYRLVPFGYAHPTQLLDAQRALRWVRAHADEFGVNPGRIGMIGFSAGGHLTAMASTQFDAGNPAAPDPIERVSSRPDFAVLGYPAIDLAGDGANRLGLVTKDTPKRMVAQLRPAENVRSETPPTFIFHTTTDELVPARNATSYYDALVKAGIPVELHIFANGRHGMGLGMTDATLSVWPSLLRTWLEGIGMIGPKAIAR